MAPEFALLSHTAAAGAPRARTIWAKVQCASVERGWEWERASGIYRAEMNRSVFSRVHTVAGSRRPTISHRVCVFFPWACVFAVDRKPNESRGAKMKISPRLLCCSAPPGQWAAGERCELCLSCRWCGRQLALIYVVCIGCAALV